MKLFPLGLRATSRGAACGIALFVVAMPAAQAITIQLSSAAVGGLIQFNPDDDSPAIGTFEFTPTSGPNFEIDNSTGVGSSIGFQGLITGTFGIGPIDTSGPIQSALVFGGGQLEITDAAANAFTADLSFQDIFTFGQLGGIQTEQQGNLTNLSYAGSDPDLLALASAPAGTQSFTFQFARPISLTDLTSGSSPTATNFSSSVSAVPIPAAVWLFGSALFGVTLLGRRKQRTQRH